MCVCVCVFACAYVCVHVCDIPIEHRYPPLSATSLLRAGPRSGLPPSRSDPHRPLGHPVQARRSRGGAVQRAWQWTPQEEGFERGGEIEERTESSC